MRRVVLCLLFLTVLLVVAAAASAQSGNVAPTIEWYKVCNASGERDGVPYWTQTVCFRGRDPDPGDTIVDYRVTDPGGAEHPASECRRRDQADGSVQISWWRKTSSLLTVGSFYLQVTDTNGATGSLTTQPTDHFPTPLPQITFPTSQQVTPDTNPVFQWDAFGGFTCEPEPTTAKSQWVGVNDANGDYSWCTCLPAGQTSAAYGYYGGPPEGTPPLPEGLKPGHSYVFTLDEYSDPAALGDGIGWYVEATERQVTFFAVSARFEWYRITNVTGDHDGASAWTQSVRFRVAGPAGEIADYGLVDVDGNAHAADECWRRDRPGGAVEISWAVTTSSPPGLGSYTLWVRDVSGVETRLTTGATTHLPAPPPHMTFPLSNQVTPDTNPVFQWDAFGGFTGLEPKPATTQWLQLVGPNCECNWCTCLPVDQTSIAYGTYAGPPTPTPPTPLGLKPGRAYIFKLQEVSDPAPFGDGLGSYEDATEQWVTFYPVARRFEWYRICSSSIENNGNPEWNQHLCFRVAGPASEIVDYRITDPGGVVHPASEYRRRDQGDGSVEIRWGGTTTNAMPPVGSYTLWVKDSLGVETQITTGATTHFPSPPPHVTVPAPNGVVPDATPVFQWDAFGGFTCEPEIGPTAPATGQMALVGTGPPDCECYWCSCVPLEQTWVTYGYYGGPPEWTPPPPHGLSPGGSYRFTLEEKSDRVPCGDGLGTITEATEHVVEFTVYSLDPVIQNVDVWRRLVVDPLGVDMYSECGNARVVDTDGWDDISVTVVDASGEARPRPDDCYSTPNDGHYTQNTNWSNAGRAGSSTPGPYTVTAIDSGGNRDEVVTAPMPALAAPDVTYPANGSVISDTAPTFTWVGSPDVASYSLYLDEAGHNTPQLWKRDQIPSSAASIAYNDDGLARDTALKPGTHYRLRLIAQLAGDDRVTDGRVSIRATVERWIEFWVAPEPAAVPIQGTMMLSMCCPGPGMVYFMSGDSANLSRAALNIRPNGDLTRDGKKVVFCWNNAAHVANADGSGETVLTLPVNPCGARWSPDGKQIAFTAPTDDDPSPEGCWRAGGEVFVVNADGTNLHRVTHHVGPDAIFSWSPDGRYLAWMRTEPTPALWWEVWVGRADGTEAHPIAGPGLPVDSGSWPLWSPDGRRVLMSWGTHTESTDVVFTMGTVAPDGSDPQPILQYTAPAADAWWFDPWGLQWSPDGRQIAFGSASQALPDAGGQSDSEVYVVNSDGTGLARVTYDASSSVAVWVGPNTPTGTAVALTICDATVTFGSVSAEGLTTSVVSPTLPGALPPGMQLQDTAYEITTSAGIAGNVSMALRYNESLLPTGAEQRLMMLRWAGDHWVDITQYPVDTTGNIARGQFASADGNHWFVALAYMTGGTDTIGLYDPAAATFRLRNSNNPGAADLTFRFGSVNWLPIAGDWNGDGRESAGVYNATTGTFYLKNTNSAGAADVTFRFGPAPSTWMPIAGDWNGDGKASVGLYNPATGTFYLKNANSAGSADVTFRFGPASSTWLPIAGDWNSDGTDSIGLYNPATGTFYLKNANSAGSADITFRYGPAPSTWKPIAGDWNKDGKDTAGLYNAATGTFYLKNANSAGSADVTFRYGPTSSTWKPVAGDWDGQ